MAYQSVCFRLMCRQQVARRFPCSLQPRTKQITNSQTSFADINSSKSHWQILEKGKEQRTFFSKNFFSSKSFLSPLRLLLIDIITMDPENCPICFEMLYEAQVAVPCKHVFCKLCCNQIQSMRVKNCPYCRQTVKVWVCNRNIARQVRQANPEGWLEKKKAEENQKLIQPEFPYLLERMVYYIECIEYILDYDPLPVDAAYYAEYSFYWLAILGRFVVTCPNASPWTILPTTVLLYTFLCIFLFNAIHCTISTDVFETITYYLFEYDPLPVDSAYYAEFSMYWLTIMSRVAVIYPSVWTILPIPLLLCIFVFNALHCIMRLYIL